MFGTSLPLLCEQLPRSHWGARLSGYFSILWRHEKVETPFVDDCCFPVSDQAATYYQQCFEQDLAISNCFRPQKVRTVFYATKRVLCLHRTARSRYVYVLSGALLMIDVIRKKVKGDLTEAFLFVMEEWSGKVNGALSELLHEELFRRPDLWAGSALDDRHVYTRYLVHGYHHLFCVNRAFHDADDACKCKNCGLVCEKYHATRCLSRRESLCVLSKRIC